MPMREARALSIVVFVVYVAVAFGVNNAFPFSTFEMYSGDAPTSPARLVVEDAAGEYHEIDRYTDWSCAVELDYAMLEQAMCPDGEPGRPLGYIVQQKLDYMRQHAATGAQGEPLVLLIHAWRLGDEIVTVDCVVTECSAVRR